MSHGPVEKDPEDWKAGDEPMTAPQESYLRTLAREAGETCPTTSPGRRPLSSAISNRAAVTAPDRMSPPSLGGRARSRRSARSPEPGFSSLLARSRSGDSVRTGSGFRAGGQRRVVASIQRRYALR